MALLDQLQAGGVKEVVSNVTGEPSDSNPDKFPRRLTQSDLVENGKALPDGEYTKTGDGFTVPAQEQYRWGFGAAEFPENQRYMYVDISGDADDVNNDGSTVQGKVRLEQRDAQERTIVTVFEDRTDGLAGSKTDRQQQVPLPEQRKFKKVGRDSILSVSFNPDDTNFVIGTASGETELLLPVTVYPV